MINERLTDPTAGERARRIRRRPEQPQLILDPTDPRAGLAFGAQTRRRTTRAVELARRALRNRAGR